MVKRNHRVKYLTIFRRIAQWTWLAIFLWLFVQTDYHGSDEIPYAVNIFFRIDPLVGAAAVLASRAWIAMVLPSVFFLLSAFVFGRWFCGWMCPLGTLLDTVHPVTRGKSTRPGNPRRHIRYMLLVVILIAALFGLPLAGLMDPFAILIRGLAVSVYPAFDRVMESLFTFTYRNAGDSLNKLSEFAYDGLKNTILPFRHSVFQWSLLSGILLAAVFLLEKWERRGFCRNICPLGAMYGLAASSGFLRAHGGDTGCGSCTICRNICRMAAIDDDRAISMTDCNLCMECVDLCPRSIIGFTWKRQQSIRQPAGTAISRRTFIGAAVTGTVLPALVGVQPDSPADLSLLRPPGARMENDFLAHCVRCGECMKVCIGNAIHPVLFEAGFSGVFSPVLLTRTGYCEYNCTLCGQVCPTGAIRRLAVEEKHQWVIGTAEFDRQRCLPFRGVNCMVCEEHCPVPDKAIRFREAEVMDPTGSKVTVKQPYVVSGRCIGCGICEHKCPLPGHAAIHVSAVGETRNPMNSDPALMMPMEGSYSSET